jgi:hypothetical protein
MKSGLRRQLLQWVILAGMAKAIAVASIFVPGSLTIASSPAQSTPLEIPTIDLNAVAPSSSSVNTGNIGATEAENGTHLSFVSPSQGWTRLLGQSLLSASAPTWDTPTGCERSCNYSFSYAAPALNCTTLSREDIWPNNNASSNSSLLKFPVLVQPEPQTILSGFGNNATTLKKLEPEPEFTYYLSSSGLLMIHSLLHSTYIMLKVSTQHICNTRQA